MTDPVTGVQRLQAAAPQDRADPWDKAHRARRRDRTDQGDKRDAAAGAVAVDRLVQTERPVVIKDPVEIAALILTGVGLTIAGPDRLVNSSVAGDRPGSSRPVAPREASRDTAR